MKRFIYLLSVNGTGGRPSKPSLLLTAAGKLSLCLSLWSTLPGRYILNQRPTNIERKALALKRMRSSEVYISTSLGR